MTDIRILLPAGLALPNENTKTHWAVRWRQQQIIKNDAYTVARLARVKPLVCAEITVVVHPGPRTRKFDPANWGPAGKPAIDGIVRAGVLPDDSSRYVPKVSYVAGDPVPGWQLELVLTPRPLPRSTR